MLTFVSGAAAETPFSTIDFPNTPAGLTQPSGINDGGDIVGSYRTSAGPTNPLHGFLLHGHYNKLDVPDAGGLTNVFGINDRGDVVGTYGDLGNTHLYGFVLHANSSFERIEAPKAAGITVATGINIHNDVVGYYEDRNGERHGFLWRNGQYATIDGPSGGVTQAFAINGRADVVGMHSSQHQGFLFAGTAAPPDPDALKNASVACVVLKRTIGSTTFAQAYRTLGRCSFALVPLEQLNIAGARASCTVEQNDVDFAAGHGGKTFERFYGTIEASFGNCVLAGTTADSEAEQRARANPLRTSGSARTQLDPRAFSQLYGGFGKCLARMAWTRTQRELKAASTCRTEQGKRGKTFARVYGTFGACTAAKANAITAAQIRATVLAATKCLREQKANPPAFKSKYRTFARCVARRA
ncbi:MAG TPA: hypothetical protein VF232_02775 [Gaiellaceae bacterium]